MNRRHYLSIAACCIALLVVIPGCAEPTEGYVHVDNGSDELIVVFVDDK
ncbi:hypothetical protein [Stieleria maiorica]|nr:hypothetical protein [Stieleria maiorica]